MPENYFSAPQTIRVGVADGIGAEEAFDTITIVAVKPGLAGADGADGLNGSNGADGLAGEPGEPGDDGLDAYTVILTNEAHTLSTTNTGVVTYTGSGTSIIVYKGISELDGITSDTPGIGQFSVSTSVENITVSTSITSTGNPIIFGDHSDMTQDIASITYTINVENLATFTKKQSFSKSIQGLNGENGSDGADGAPGADGADGAPGADGLNGPGIVFRGVYDANKTYVKTDIRTDVVQYPNDTGTYYSAKENNITGAFDTLK